jgi:capsid protein
VTVATSISLPAWAGTDTPAPQAKAGRRVSAVRYEIAQGTPENRNHWAGADTLSPTASLSFNVRDLARRRARYEVGNSSVLRGMIESLCEDVIGTGPRLQILTTSPDQRAAARRLEMFWKRWVIATKLNEKLRCAYKAWKVDGEAFLLFTNNPRSPHPVKLDVRLVESDQVEHPQNFDESPTRNSGLEFDEWGNVTKYNVLKWHPGDKFMGANPLDADKIDAGKMLHVFRMDRPGQVRGFSEVATMLGLMAARRRYTKATVTAAETVASMAAVLETDTAPNGTEDGEPGDTFDLPSGQIVTLPGGWHLKQVDAKQPTATHSEFSNNLLREGARCLLMPMAHASGDASGYNYSSARFDHMRYGQHVNVERERFNEMVLAPMFVEFMREAMLLSSLWGGGPAQFPLVFRTQDVPYAWGWNKFAALDPEKEAKAQGERLRNGTALLSDELNSDRDIDDHLLMMKEQMLRVGETGFTPQWMVAPYANVTQPAADPTDTQEPQQ